MNKHIKFFLAIALQIVIIFSIIALKILFLSSGTIVTLRIHPIDPTSPLRGDYITFEYDIASFDSALLGSEVVYYGDIIYVTIVETGDFWTVESASKVKPIDQSRLFLRGVVVDGGFESRPINPLTGELVSSNIRLRFGAEEYFISEGNGRDFSFEDREVAARVSVGSDGSAILESILVDSKPWP